MSGAPAWWRAVSATRTSLQQPVSALACRARQRIRLARRRCRKGSVVPPPAQGCRLRTARAALLVPVLAASPPVRPQGGSPSFNAEDHRPGRRIPLASPGSARRREVRACARATSSLAAAAKAKIPLASRAPDRRNSRLRKNASASGESSSFIARKPAARLREMPTGTTSARQADYLGALILTAMSMGIRSVTRIHLDFRELRVFRL